MIRKAVETLYNVCYYNKTVTYWQKILGVSFFILLLNLVLWEILFKLI